MLKTYNWDTIDKLKAAASVNPLLRSRLLIHESTNDQVQQMLIVLHYNSIIDMHRHPIMKSESYQLIEGTMKVSYWDAHEGRFWFKEYSADPQRNSEFFGRHSAGLWHMPQSLTEWCVYLETYDGPFEKETDVEYISTN